MSSDQPRRVACIVGARPNLVKIAPVLRALAARPRLNPLLVHTGQHYDAAMNAVFFEELRIPAPDINLGIGPGTASEQTARILLALEPVLKAERPDFVVVVGDVTSTLAAALAAAQAGLCAAHVEAGLRSFDRTMPEELNRIVTDRLCDLLLASEPAGVANLVREGINPNRIALVGNVMIDTLLASLDRAPPAETTLAATGADASFVADVRETGYGLVTLHRPSNVDDPVSLGAIVEALVTVSARLPLVFPLHPRTQAALAASGYDRRFAAGRVHATGPLGYLATLGLMRTARLAITDSGGVQEETTVLGVPCLTLRENTERPITVDVGTNTIVGTSPGALIAAAEHVLAHGGKRGRVPDLWDGKAAERIADKIERVLT